MNKLTNHTIDNFITRLLDSNQISIITKDFVRKLCISVKPIFLAESSLLEIDLPIKICGDIHGHLKDLVQVFTSHKLPPFSQYLFLGDYVDRGKKSVEVICLLFALKLRYPKNIFLLRGNHEGLEMTEKYGFKEECEKKLDHSSYRLILSVFDTLPVAAVVGKQYFCVHGGISPKLSSLDDINIIHRPTEIPDSGLLTDLLWSDPNSSKDNWSASDRGISMTWGSNIAKAFLHENHLSCIVRGHQMASNGYDFPFHPEKHTVTLFTASKYSTNHKNYAAIMSINNETGFSLDIVAKASKPSKVNI